MKVTEEQFTAAKAKDARAKKITVNIVGDIVEVVVRPPTRAEYKGWKALANSGDESKAAGANEQLVTFCTLVPDPKTSQGVALFDQYAGLADTLALHIKRIAGVSDQVVVGE